MTTVALWVVLAALNPAAVENDGNWPGWRGPDYSGIARQANPPSEWSETQNVRWKVAVPGRGSGSPIVWGDRVYLLSAVPVGESAGIGSELAAPGDGSVRSHRRRGIRPDAAQRFVLLALDRRDGSVIWSRTARQELPHEGTHADGTWASSTPVTDGEHIYAFFGSQGLFCFDMKGNLIWEKDLGNMRVRRGFGEGSSPLLHGDKIVVNWDHEDDSFIVALDKKTGAEVWRAPRDEPTSWATPIAVEYGASTQVISSATNRVRSYDLQTGKLIWESGGMTLNVIPTPVSADGIVYVTSGFRGNALQAIKLSEAKGDITGSSAIAWSHDQDTPYVPSPLLYGDTLYFLKRNSAILSCFDPGTGKAHYTRQRLVGLQGVYASPVGAGQRVYIAGRNGTTLVLKRGPAFEVLATNKLDEGIDASPAISGDEIFLRGRSSLYCIASK